MANCYDVVIVGGGPAGSTTGALLKKYNPQSRVAILEREQFPRDHVGESQLPAVCHILNEVGVWDKVEAAGFPVKIGSTYKWGTSEELWNVNFLPGAYTEDKRPGKYEGQRARLAFQVDRSKYDTILLEHAKSVGCEVYQEMKAGPVASDDRIERINARQGGVESTFEARHYVDASGAVGLFRRALNINTDSPTHLRNIAFWDYWQNTEWAETVGNGGTRVQIMSIGWGWLWFIPIGPTRTSIGLVLPAEYFKKSGKKAEELYLESIAAEPRIKPLLKNAISESRFSTTRDWNFVSERLTGENWFLAGDSCGFADPILSAGMTLAQVSARKVAYSILEIDKGQTPAHLIKKEYNERHARNIRHHIRFAEFWYSGNGHFSDLQDYCAEIAKSAGIDLTPEQAFQWLGSGGFASDFLIEDRSLAFGFLSAKAVVGRFVGSAPEREILRNNTFKLNLEECKAEPFAVYHNGRVLLAKSYHRGEKILPLVGTNQLWVHALERESDATRLSQLIWSTMLSNPAEYPDPGAALRGAFEALEALIADGWVRCSMQPGRPLFKISSSEPAD